jgi:OPA family glycerol-3-phosphate transporter-like MFS transporter
MRGAADGPPEQTRPPRSLASYRVATLTSLIVGYGGYYLCRMNLPAAQLVLHDELGMSTQTFGTLISVGNAVYALGKFAGGAATDTVGGRRIFFIGLFGSVLATAAFGATGGATAILLCWALNRAFQSLGWAGALSVLSRWYTPAEYGRTSGALSVSYQFGGVVATLFAGFLLARVGGWRILFFGPALALAIVGVMILPRIKSSPADVGYSLPQDRNARRVEDAAPLTLNARLRLLLLSGPFLIVCALSFVLTLLRESFNTWLPVYFSQMGGTAYQAVFKSALFPLLGCAGTIVAGWLSDKYFRENRGPILAAFLAVAACVLFALARPESVTLWASVALGLNSGSVAMGLVALAGFFVLAPYSMVGGGVFALDHGGRRAAGTAAGLLDGIGYTASIMAGIGVGRMLAIDAGDFRIVYEVMAWALVASAGLGALLSFLRPRSSAA